MRAAFRHPRVLALIAGLVAGCLTTFGMMIAIFSKPPVQIVSATQMEANAVEGGLLELHYQLYRTSTCNSPSTVWMWRWMDDLPTKVPLPKRRYIVKIDSNPITLSDVSPLLQDFILARELPRMITAGDWFLRIKYLDSCGLFPTIFGATPRTIDNLPITVRRRE